MEDNYKSLNKYKFILIIGVIFLLIIIAIFISKNYSPKDEIHLVLVGSESITIYEGTDYIEPGYQAYNDKKDDLTNQVKIKSNLNTNKIGEYKITYTIKNNTKTRNINVIEKPKEYTSIYLSNVNGDKDIYLKLGEKYIEPGYQVFSSSGINLTSQVKITGKVDETRKGVYKLTYSVINSNNVTITTTRTVFVMDSEIKLDIKNKNYTNDKTYIDVVVNDDFFDYLILPDNTKTTNKTYSYAITQNGKYNFKSYNKKGLIKESSIEVNNIDKTPPNGSCSGKYENGKTTIKINATDNIAIDRYVINGKTYKENNITINDRLYNAYITIYDVAKNKKDISCNIEENNSINTDELEIHFISSSPYDDAILIRSNKAIIFIDGGRWSCRKQITPYLKNIGITNIDAMIGSHLHYNHIQMQADILTNFEVKNIYYPDDIFTCNSKNSCNTEDQKYIVSELKNQNKIPQIIKAGTKISVGDIELYFIGPDKINTTGGYPQNANSFINILKYKNNTFMFTGDAGSNNLNVSTLKKYADQLGISLDIDVLKYPHHGNTSLTNSFLEATTPKYAIVPNYNAPHYPNSSDTDKLNKYNITMYRQSDSSTGNILIKSDGNNIKIINNVTAENYKK